MPFIIMNLTLILVGILGLFVISLMLFSYRSNKLVNIYLAVIFIICSFRNILIGLPEVTSISKLILVPKYISPIFLIVVPCLFLYFKSLVQDYKRIYKRDVLHFLYPLLNLLLNLGQEYFPVLKNQSIENIRFVSLMAFFIVYLILSFNFLYSNLWKQGISKSVDTRHYYLIKNWTLFLFTISTFLFLRILYSIYSEKISNELIQAQNHSYIVIIPWLLIYGKILVNPEILYGYPKLEKTLMKAQKMASVNNDVWVYDLANISNLQDKSISCNIKNIVLPYISNIEHFVNKKHPFRNSKFSLADLAKSLNMPVSHIHYIFKYHAVVSFVEYKNYCRINDAQQIISKGLGTLSLEKLANKVGFSSYNLFFDSFKNHTQQTPNEYLNRQINVL
ncbi:helix-turn-helix domain-containing protein [Flavobacteriaceae bacterium LMO-SS05]